MLYDIKNIDCFVINDRDKMMKKKYILFLVMCMTQSMWANRIAKEMMLAAFGGLPEFYNERSPLINASESGYLVTVRSLLENGVSVNAEGPWGNTALHYVGRDLGRSYPKKHDEDIIRLLVEHGGDIKKTNCYGRTPLMASVAYSNLGAVKTFLDLCANVNSTDSFGATPLIISACNRRSAEALSVMDLLLKHKAKVNKRNCFGWTALHYAARTGRKEMVQRLLKAGACPKIKNFKGEEAVDIALKKGHVEIALLIGDAILTAEEMTKSIHSDKKSKNKITNKKGTNKVAKNLIYMQRTVDKGEFSVALKYAMADGDKALVKASMDSTPEVLYLLLNAGADINAKGLHGDSPLIAALMKRKLLNARFLLENGALVNSSELYSIGGPCRGYVTTLGHFGGREQIRNLLLEFGADIEKKGRAGRTPLMEMVLEQRRLDGIKALLDLGANINTTDPYGKTPLMASADKYYSLSILDLLLQYDSIDVNKQNIFGWTALHYAARTGKREIVEKLLDADASPTIKNYKLKTAADIARECEHKEVAQLIESYMLVEKSDQNIFDAVYEKVDAVCEKVSAFFE